MTLVQVAIGNWNDFDGWCLTHGIEPLEMPSRRFFSAVWRWLSENRDEEGMNKLHTDLDQVVYDIEREHKKLTAKKPATEAPATATEPGKPQVVLLKNMQTVDPDWRPPGWKSDEEAYGNAMGFVSQQASGFRNKK